MTPGVTTAYTLTCTGAGGSANQSATVTVTTPPPAPTNVDLDIRKAGTSTWTDTVTINAGEQVELNWTSTGATRCVGDAHYSTGGSSPTNGTQSTVAEPASGNRTYTVTCYNGPGSGDPSTSAVASVSASTITGDPEITANPTLVDYNMPGTVLWTLNGHTGCTVIGANGDIVGSNLTTDGSGATAPLLGETTYTLSCPDGGNADSVTIRVRPRFEEI